MKVLLENKSHDVDIYVNGISLDAFPSDIDISQLSVWIDGAMAAFLVGRVLTNCSDFTDEQITTIVKSAISE